MRWSAATVADGVSSSSLVVESRRPHRRLLRETNLVVEVHPAAFLTAVDARAALNSTFNNSGIFAGRR
jgi:hypothetical protein